MRLLEEFHTNGKIVRGFNLSFITLIPKKDKVITMNDFRLISLIGCVYKIISKILVERLSKVMDNIISENQSAFVRNRLIHDGVVILNESINEVKNKKLARIFFKIDFAKAYNSVEWGFLDDIMKILEFDVKWQKWIMECVSSAKVNVLVNGSPSGEFKLERERELR